MQRSQMNRAATRLLCALLLTFCASAAATAQIIVHLPANLEQQVRSSPPSPAVALVSAPQAASSESIPLTIPAGTPLRIALDKELRIHNPGQAVHATLAEPVFAYDKLLVPAGSEVLGTVARIEPVSAATRTLGVLNADLSPAHDLKIEFDQLLLPGGKRLAIHTRVTPGVAGVLEFVPANAPPKSPGAAQKGKNLAVRKVADLHQQIQRDWDDAKKQVHEPGKVHKLERLALAQLPYHPQYLDAGTPFNAELQQPLDFGAEKLPPEAFSLVGSAPPAGSVVHALLLTPLSSASSRQGDAVEAVITQPLFASSRLILPQGSHLKGVVTQVRPARRLARNGQLRIVFHQVVPPGGFERKVDASLEGVAVGKQEHLKLDSEGGAQATSPRTRYLSTAISVGLVTASASEDRERGSVDPGGDPAKRGASGASGFRVIGLVLSTAVRSRAVSTGFGAFGASRALYSHFLARGRDVVYPKDTPMVIGFGTRTSVVAAAGEKPLPK